MGLIVTKFLDRTIHTRWGGTDGPNAYSSRPPDLIPMDFFLFVYMKEQAYLTKLLLYKILIFFNVNIGHETQRKRSVTHIDTSL
jgi:hypothetical protein